MESFGLTSLHQSQKFGAELEGCETFGGVRDEQLSLSCNSKDSASNLIGANGQEHDEHTIVYELTTCHEITCHSAKHL